MAAQRIVLTSPWKLGLFVFMLVAGTGFGLIWAYIELFGGQIDLRDEKVLRLAYAVLGGVAGLGLLGYIAVVSSARPLERVVRNSRHREQLLKRFGKIQDPRMVEIEEYDEEPALKVVLERWAEQAAAASDARLNNASQNEALARLTTHLRENDVRDFDPELPESTPDLDALVDAIRGIASTVNGTAEAPAEQPLSRPVPGVDEGWTEERSTWRAAAEQLFVCEQELEGFVRSVADHASEIASRTGNLSKHSGALPREAAMSVENLRRNGLRMGKVREASELLSGEANKIALGISMFVERSGAPNQELTSISDRLRTLSAQYQRVAAEAELSRSEQDEALDRLMDLEVTTLDSSAANALAQQAMALDQHAEALGELLGRFRQPMEKIRGVAPDVAAANPAGVPEPPKFIAPEPAQPEPAQPEAVEYQAPEIEPIDLEEPVARPVDDTADFGMAGDPQAAGEAEAARIYEIAELGGRELAAAANANGADPQDRVYDLDEFGAVEL